MNPLVKSLAGMAVRALMMFAGAHGVNLPNENAETLVDAALVLGALAWSAYQKYRTHEVIETAQMQVVASERRR